jgi:hypothetical protein
MFALVYYLKTVWNRNCSRVCTVREFDDSWMRLSFTTVIMCSGSCGEGTWNPLSAFHLFDPTCRIPQCLRKLSGGRKLALYVRTWNVTNDNCCQFSLLYADKRNQPRGPSCEASARRWVACTLWGWGRKVACKKLYAKDLFLLLIWFMLVFSPFNEVYSKLSSEI